MDQLGSSLNSSLISVVKVNHKHYSMTCPLQLTRASDNRQKHILALYFPSFNGPTLLIFELKLCLVMTGNMIKFQISNSITPLAIGGHTSGSNKTAIKQTNTSKQQITGLTLFTEQIIRYVITIPR